MTCLIMVLLVGLSWGAPRARGLEPLDSDIEKMQEMQEMFSSEYQEEDYYRTDRLLLTATKRNISMRKAPAIVTVITAEEIRNMGARDFSDVMRMVPGFGISITEFGYKMYEVRGIRTQYSENILVMIDGHQLNRNMSGTALYNVGDDLAVDKIKQIEVIRGPGSALYGANAFLGVINIITKEAYDIDGLEVTMAGGSNDFRKVNFLGGHIFDNGLNLSGSLNYFKTNGEEHWITRDGLGASGNAWLGAEKAELFLKTAFKDFTFRGHYIIGRRTGHYIGFGNALTNNSVDPITNYWGELTHQYDISDDLSSTIKLFYDYYEQESKVEIFPAGWGGSYPDGVIGKPFLKDRTHGADLELDYDVSRTNHLIVGTHFERMTQFDVKAFNNFHPLTYAYLGSIQDITTWGNWNRDAKREIWALYGQDEWEIRNNLNLTAGLRYDHYSEFGSTTNPRAGLVWGFHKNIDLKVLYGQAFKAPSFVELYNQNNPVNIGNENLQPAEIKTYEIGLGARLAKSFTIDCNYFNNQIDDQIIWDTSVVPSVHVNAGKYEVDGIELVVTGNYNPDDYWKITYTYQNPRNGETGGRLPYVPSQRAGLAVNYGFNQYLNLHTDVLWSDSRPRDTGDNRSDIPSCAIVDLSAIVKNFHANLEIQATIHNLLDSDYRDPDRSGATQSILYDYPRDGRSVILSMVYNF